MPPLQNQQNQVRNMSEEPEDKFNPVRRNSLKNINVSNIADILKSKFEPQISSTNQPNHLVNIFNETSSTSTNSNIQPVNHVKPYSNEKTSRPKSGIQHFSFPKPILNTTTPLNPSAVSINNPPKSTFSFQLSSQAVASSTTQTAGFYLQSICADCGNKVSIMERQNVLHLVLHTHCFKCNVCRVKLDSSSYEHQIDPDTRKCTLFFYIKNICNFLSN